MSNEKIDRLKRLDKAIDKVRREFDEVIDESKLAGSEARQDVRAAIDDIESRTDDRPTATDE